MDNYEDLINADYYIPDPDWDYSEIWHECQQARQGLEWILAVMQQVDSATVESGRQIKEALDAIRQRLNTARRMMDM